MPIVCITTITSTLVPLTSCNKNKKSSDIKVNAQEWQNAINYLCLDKEGAQWKSTGDDRVDIYETVENDGKKEIILAGYGNMSMTQDAQKSDLFTYIKDGEHYKSEFFNKSMFKKNKFYFDYDWYRDESGVLKLKNGDISTNSSLIESFKLIFSLYVDFEDFIYDNNKHGYVYSGEYEDKEGIKISLNTKMSFNSNKLISSMETDLIADFKQTTNNEEPTTMSIQAKVSLHPQYENISVDIEPTLIERANKHSFEMTTQRMPYLVDCSDGLFEGMLLNITAYSDLETGELVFTEFNDNIRWPNVKGIYKNDVLLLEGGEGEHDYWINDENGHIIFHNPILISDKISIALSFGGMHITGADYDVVAKWLNGN